MGKKLHAHQTRRSKEGMVTIVSTVILIAAVSIMGSLMFIWANTGFVSQQRIVGDQIQESGDAIKEIFVIEDVWFSEIPADYVNMTLKNVGSISIKIKNIQVVNSTGSFIWTPSNDIIILPGKSAQMDIPYAWDSECDSLDISVNTSRGSLERILWKMSCQ